MALVLTSETQSSMPQLNPWFKDPSLRRSGIVNPLWKLFAGLEDKRDSDFGFRRLLLSGERSDVTLVIEGVPFELHTLILRQQSTWFEENISVEPQGVTPKTITLQEDSVFSDALLSMIVYFYTGGYRVPDDHGMLHLKVAIIARKYDCFQLRYWASDQFIATLEENMCGSVNEIWMSLFAFLSDNTLEDKDLRLRQITIDAVLEYPQQIEKLLKMSERGHLLEMYSHGTLTADLLDQIWAEQRRNFEQILLCAVCGYAHVRIGDCSMIKGASLKTSRCPRCKHNKASIVPLTGDINIGQPFPCPTCGAWHNDVPLELCPVIEQDNCDDAMDEDVPTKGEDR